MIELPLFPLNTVLFPGMPLELHIFEERYKLMIGSCVEKRTPFGVVLLEQGTAELDPAGRMPAPKPYMIGCTAQITQVKPLTDGRMNITAVGRERFRILSLHDDKPYLVAMVEMYPIENGDTRTLMRGNRTLRGWIERYLRILEQAGQIQFDPTQLPNEPMSMAYLGAVLLQGISPLQKQGLLSSEQMTGFVNNLCSIYRREIVLLESLLTPPQIENAGPFSLN